MTEVETNNSSPDPTSHNSQYCSFPFGLKEKSIARIVCRYKKGYALQILLGLWDRVWMRILLLGNDFGGNETISKIVW